MRPLPQPGQGKAGVLADDVHHGRFQLACGDVLGVGPAQRLREGDFGSVPGGLARSEVAAVAEHGEQVALDRLGKLWIGARWRPEVAGVPGPVFGMLEDVEEMALLHAGADLLFELGHPGWLPCRFQLLEVRGSVGIKAEFGVAGEAGVHGCGKRRQLRLEHGREILAAAWNAEGGAVGRQPRLAFVPGQELGAVIGEGLGARHVKVAHLQGAGEVDEHAYLKCAPVERDGPGPAALGDEGLPALG